MPPYKDAITSSPDLANFGYPFGFIIPKTINYLAFKYFDFKRT